MGCLNSKPKPKPQTIVVHSCDYHTHAHHSSNGIVGILKSRSPSPSRYATDTADTTAVVPVNIKTDEQSKYVRKKPVSASTRSLEPSPSPHSDSPFVPEPEETIIHVMDAEDLEPADNPTPEPEAGTKSSLSNEKSEATVSKIRLNKHSGPSSVVTSQTQASKQSLLSSHDTLHVEEFEDSEMDDFSRMRLVSNNRPKSESHLTRNKTFVVKQACRLPYRPNSERVRPMLIDNVYDIT